MRNLFKKKPKILITNDDGIDAAGIWLLAEAATAYGDVTIVAPSEEQSAMSHGISRVRMQVLEYKSPYKKIKAYHVPGKPADCVITAHEELGLTFDYVLSGVNHGTNLGVDINYSGTVGAASEAIIYGIPAAAFSSTMGNDEVAKNELKKVLDFIFEKQLWQKETIINVNFPKSKTGRAKGIQMTRQAMIMERPFTEGSDLKAWDAGFVSITPIGIDRTRHDLLKEWERYNYEW